ncbi:MAG: xanthine dehydrogenase family protein subunit M [Actinomycetia bacterium]|nr:xanthine dehydrogenase family protein subunit M [Actinomycetes bacterium]
MKPSPFEYSAPASLEEALEVLAEAGSGAKVLAGGQSLVPLMNLRLAAPEHLVDLNGVGSLSEIRADDGGLAIGAMARQSTLERSTLVEELVPALAHAASHIGHFQVRNRGTVGGSLAHADPTAELPMILLAAGGRVTVQSKARGARAVEANDLVRGYFTTAIEPDEILTEAWFPRLEGAAGWSFQEVARRHGDFALVAAATVVRLDGDTVADAVIALAGVADRPVRAAAAEELITGEAPSAALAEHAADAVRGELSPTGDVHASSEYRREVAGVLVGRALSEAAQRAQAGS